MINSDTLRLESVGPSEIVISRKFNTTSSALYKAYVHPEILKSWLMGPPGWTMTVCTFEPQVGGSYRYEWKHDSGYSMGLSGKIQEIAPNKKIVISEQFDESWYPGQALVTTTFEYFDKDTTLMKTNIKYESPEAMTKVLNSGMEQGLSISYDRLEEWFSNKH
jgi:uncharacterized protein YndB with AHSA1/START domain